MPSAATARGYQEFVVGPIRVGHGYELQAFGIGCYSGYLNLFTFASVPYGVRFSKSIPGGTEVHNYGYKDQPPTCDFATGTFKLTLGRLATINVTFHPSGNSWTGAGPEPCGSRQVVQPGTMTGTVRVDIDPSYFGSVDLHRVRGSIRTEEAPLQCGQFTQMTAYFGPTGAKSRACTRSPLPIGAAGSRS